MWFSSLISLASLSIQTVPCETLIEYSSERDGVSLIVLQGGEIVCEDYPDNHRPDEGWSLASGTKSFTGIMAAAAVQDGLMRLDERASLTLTEWQGDRGLSQITIADLLSLSSGIEVSNTRNLTYQNAVNRAEAVHEPGEVFAYGPAPFQIFGEILVRKLEGAGHDEDPRDYLQRRVLDHLGVEPTNWRDRVGGMAHLPSGAAFTARDWALFGQFVLQGGEWDGEQLVDPDALASLFEGTEANSAYGISWWLPHRFADGVSPTGGAFRTGWSYNPVEDWPEVWMAAGAGDQKLYVIPSLELVIVRQTGTFQPRQPWSEIEFLAPVLN